MEIQFKQLTMKDFKAYITEKLHLTADNKGNLINEPLHARLCKVASDEVNRILEDAFGPGGRLHTTEYMVMLEDDRGTVIDDNPKNEEKIARLYFWSNDERFTRNTNNIAQKVSKVLNRIKEVKKAEAFATSFTIYFKDYKSA